MAELKALLGAKIKKLREQHGMSQEKLAALLNIKRSSLSQVERGGRDVKSGELIKLSTVFDISVDELLDRKKSPEVILDKKEPGKDENVHIRISVPQKNLKKFKEVLLYILNKVGAKPNVGETVIYKLLYFMDFDFYELFEEQLTGASYRKNHHGPTPVEFAKIVEEMIANNEIEKIKSKYFDYPQTKYLPLRQPRLEFLKANEQKVIDDVLNRLSDMNAGRISEYSHKDVPWLTTGDREIIDYEAVFYRTSPYSQRCD
ncbi:MAG: DUF4065 domain-containing protein [Candidatus Aminicenantes bacterium]|nr:DUF4065 domain-containing protein [Candidatus Aminicenantes bacterium]